MIGVRARFEVRALGGPSSRTHPSLPRWMGHPSEAASAVPAHFLPVIGIRPAFNVILSAAKNLRFACLSPWRCFAALSMTALGVEPRYA
jgi:hypothetical protein